VDRAARHRAGDGSGRPTGRSQPRARASKSCSGLDRAYTGIDCRSCVPRCTQGVLDLDRQVRQHHTPPQGLAGIFPRRDATGTVPPCFLKPPTVSPGHASARQSNLLAQSLHAERALEERKAPIGIASAKPSCAAPRGARAQRPGDGLHRGTPAPHRGAVQRRTRRSRRFRPT
jgi:hypothetical protein